MTLKVGLPWPPSVNLYWRHGRGRTYIDKPGKTFRENVAAAIGGERLLMQGRLVVDIEAHPPDNRRRDLDNVLKALLDALEHAGVYEDDSQIDKLSIVRQEVRRPKGCVVVTVRQVVPPRGDT